jgi:steroid delta-isomerase-like uncharacterized protein
VSDAKAHVERAWQAYIRHDLDSLMEAYAEDAVLSVPGAPPAQGHDAIRQVWGSFLSAFPDDSPSITRIVAEGSTVVVEFSSGGTNSGPLALPTGETLPPTGRTVHLSGLSIADLEDGRIKRESFYWDSLSFAAQLGLLPEPAAQTA